MNLNLTSCGFHQILLDGFFACYPSGSLCKLLTVFDVCWLPQHAVPVAHKHTNTHTIDTPIVCRTHAQESPDCRDVVLGGPLWKVHWLPFGGMCGAYPNSALRWRCRATQARAHFDAHAFTPQELASPYMAFSEEGFDVEIASISGGKPPIDPISKEEKAKTANTKRFEKCDKATEQLENTKGIGEYISRVGEFDAVFLPGGHGASVDFASRYSNCSIRLHQMRVREYIPVFPASDHSAALKEVLEGVYEKGGIIGAVCHGPCALVTLMDRKEGKPLVAGKRVTAFSDEEEKSMDMYGKVPFSMEQELQKLGATYEHATPWGAMVITDGRLVTGQNPASCSGVARGVVELLKRGEQ